MKFGVVTFPGSNCDEDMVYVLQDLMGQQVERLWHKDTDLKGVDFVVLPGGFSYGDYLRSGAIAKFSPIMDEVIAHANKGGYVMGICNGFQALVSVYRIKYCPLILYLQSSNCCSAFSRDVVLKKILVLSFYYQPDLLI